MKKVGILLVLSMLLASQNSFSQGKVVRKVIESAAKSGDIPIEKILDQAFRKTSRKALETRLALFTYEKGRLPRYDFEPTTAEELNEVILALDIKRNPVLGPKVAQDLERINEDAFLSVGGYVWNDRSIGETPAREVLLSLNSFVEKYNRWPRAVIYKNEWAVPHTPEELEEIRLYRQAESVLKEAGENSTDDLAVDRISLLRKRVASRPANKLLAEAENFVATNNHWPREYFHKCDVEEAQLHDRIEDFLRDAHRDTHIEPETQTIATILEHKVIFNDENIPETTLFYVKLRNLQHFILRENRWPSIGAADQVERSLAYEIEEVLNKAGRNTSDQSVQEILRIKKGFISPEEQLRLDAETFIATHNRLPRAEIRMAGILLSEEQMSSAELEEVRLYQRLCQLGNGENSTNPAIMRIQEIAKQLQ